MTSTLVELLSRSVARHTAAPAIGVKDSGAWRWTSYRELGDQVAQVRAGLAAQGVGSGDRVALSADNRLEWAVVAHAVVSLGAVLVPIPPAQHRTEEARIVADAGAKLVVCAEGELFARAAALPGVARVGLDLPAEHAASYQRLRAEGRAQPVPAAAVAPDDAACILYTPGTESAPKGVVLSHRSICSNVDALLGALPLGPGDSSLSVLPWSLSFAHTCELQAMLSLGAPVALASSHERLVAELGEIQPTVLVAVPRLLRAIYERVRRDIAAKPAVIQTLFARALKLRRAEHDRRLSFAERLMLDGAERAVLGPLRARLGGKLRYLFCGGATLALEVAQFLDDLGLPIYEGYGLTEAGPVVTINRPGHKQLGSVGRPLPGVEVSIDAALGPEAGQGEIVVASPSLMLGYYRRPEETAEVLREGRLRTGDLGFVDADGYLHITGRLVEQYKLESGLAVTPDRLEEPLKGSRFIRAAMVHGEGRPYNVALVVVDVDALSAWAEERDLHFASTADMLASPRVKSHMLAEIGERSQGWRSYERIRDVVLCAETFTAQGGILTPALELRRDAALSKYGDAIAALYGSPAG
jgi:long-chain acyl-CoA synthetase